MGSRWSLRANDAVLKAAMNAGRPIRDSVVDPATGKLIPAKAGSVLERERNQLLREGWKFQPKTGEWKSKNVCTGSRLSTGGECF